jgi:hypothetical protein
MFCNKGIVMQRRVYLLFILFVVLAAFYASLAREVPEITAKQQAQTEQFNHLDETVLAKPGQADSVASGK